jgi:DNA topoisomerase I
VLGDSPPKGAKAKTSSLFKTMSLDTITLEEALRLLQLPRLVGVDPTSGEEIMALNGRYGPYLKKGTDSRSITSEEQLLTIDLGQALAIYAEPKQRGGRAASGPLRELGQDPASGLPVVVRDGRFGPYVSDGEFNATLRKGDEPETITLERAAELLADKRASGPAPKKRAVKKTAAKKTTPRKSATKSVAKTSTSKATTAKKTTAKKTTAKKTTATTPTA